MILKKKIPASACRKKKKAIRTNVIESLWEKKGKKYPAHQIARKKILDDQKSPPPPPRVKLSMVGPLVRGFMRAYKQGERLVTR